MLLSFKNKAGNTKYEIIVSHFILPAFLVVGLVVFCVFQWENVSEHKP